jgi:subtilisin family serine protease
VEDVWPAALAGTHPNVVSVAALDASGEPAPWSSRREGTTFSAIGEGVVSTYVKGEEDGALIGDPHPDTYGDNAWALWTGTSFAAPQITGALARLVMSNEHDMTPAEAVAELHRRGSTPEKPDEYGTRVRILPGT